MEEIYSNISEINPQEVFSNMIKDIYDNYPSTSELNIDEEYLKIRPNIINLLHKISKKMGFKSQTFFLSKYYLDIILLQNKTITTTNLYLLGLSCFIVASKYCENDPIVPPLENFLNFYNRYNPGSDNKIKAEELFAMEVHVIKYLNYEMHYVSIYDFNLFFFNHGIIKKQQIKDIINNNVNLKKNNKNNKSDISSNEDDNDFIYDSNYIKKILEKIYKKSRYYLELIIINDKICFKYNVLLLSIYIMKKSIEEIILNEYKLKNKDYYLNKRQIIKKTNIYFKEVMNNFYKIDFESDEKYQELIEDKNIINIFPQQEKMNELKTKKNIKNNLTKFKKVLPNTKKNFKEYKYIRKNNVSNNTLGISNLATSSTMEENKSPTIIRNNLASKSKILSQYNSKEKLENIRKNNTLFENYNKNNTKIFHIKTLQNSKKHLNENNNNSNSNINIDNDSNSYIEKGKINCTFTQLKNNLKKDFSINKKRCKDRYSYINNLKSLCKLTSCSNTIKNIKENNIYNRKELSESPNNINININTNNEENEVKINRINSILDNSKDILLLKKLRKTKNLKNYYSKDKINNKKNLNIFDTNKEDDINKSSENICDESIHSNPSKKKNKNIKLIKTRVNTLNLNNNEKSPNNINKLYFKKVIHNNFEPKKKTLNKNSITININNILNKSNYNNIKNNNVYKTTTNKDINYISLSNKYKEENKLELIRNRIKTINERNENLDNLLINKSNNIKEKILKNINNKINKKSDVNIENILESNSESVNIDKKSKIPKIPKNLKISINFYNEYNIKNNIRYEMNQSPISFLKEINTININNDIININKNIQDLGLRQTSSTIENTASYHKKKIFNSLNKNKNRIMNSFVNNDDKNVSGKNHINLMKIEGNSSYNKYKNDAYISLNRNNNLFNKKIIHNGLNSFNTIDSTKNNIERNKTVENEQL